MTKHLLIMAVLLISMTAGARTTMKHAVPGTQRMAKQTFTLPVGKHMVKRQAEENKSQLHVGYVKDEENFQRNSFIGGMYKTASYVGSDLLKKYKGCSIVGLRVLLGSEKVSNVSAWLDSDVEKNRIRPDLATAKLNDPVMGWNEVLFSTPYVIKGTEDEEFFMGFTYTSTSKVSDDAPLVTVPTVKVNGGFCVYLDLDNELGAAWYDASYEYGALAIQMILEGDLPDYDLSLYQLSTEKRYYKADETLRMAVYLSNNGVKEMEGLVLNVNLDENLFTQIKYPQAVTSAEGLAQFEIKISELNLSVGKHTLSVTAAGLDTGAPELTAIDKQYVDDSTTVSTFAIYQNSLTRNQNILELYTNTHSAYDPYQIEAIEQMLNLREDVIPVFIHGDYYGEEADADTFAIEEALYYATNFWLTSTPAMVINRVVVPGAEEMLEGINAASIQPNYLSEMVSYIDGITPAFATVNIAPTLSDDKKTLTLEISGIRNADFEAIFKNGALTVYLTEDQITAPQAIFDETDEVAIDENYVHQHVLRKVISAEFGDPIEWNGLRYKKEYNIPVEEGWNLRHMNAVAFISKDLADAKYLDDVEITNAASVALRTIPTVGIRSTEQATSKVETFTLGGSRVNGKLRPGIYLQKSGDKVQKVMVR